MKALDLFRKKQMEIENDKKDVQNIINLIKLEEKEFNQSKDNQSYHNNESENNNSLFILNRYANKKYNNKINASNLLQKNKSTTNIHSSLYNFTTNSTINNNNETKMTSFNKRPIRIMKRNSVNTNLDYSEYTLENNFNDTGENKDNTEYIHIMDTSNVDNPINAFNQIKKISNNNSSLRFKSKNKDSKNKSSTLDKNEEISSLYFNDNNKTRNDIMSEFTNVSTQKKRLAIKVSLLSLLTDLNR